MYEIGKLHKISIKYHYFTFESEVYKHPLLLVGVSDRHYKVLGFNGKIYYIEKFDKYFELVKITSTL